MHILTKRYASRQVDRYSETLTELANLYPCNQLITGMFILLPLYDVCNTETVNQLD